jgi:transcription antitermination factor NusG
MATRCWRVIYTRPNAEAPTAGRLEQLLLPTIFLKFTERVTQKGRVVEVERPYFSRYLFALVPDTLHHTVKDLDGVCAIVSQGGRPVEVPDKVVWALHDMGGGDGSIGMVDMTRRRKTFTGRKGDKVRLSGPFFGLAAEVASTALLEQYGDVEVFVQMLGGRRKMRVHADLLTA